MHTIDIIRVSITLLVFVSSISLVSTGDLIFRVMGHDTPDQHRCESTFSDPRVLVGGREEHCIQKKHVDVEDGLGMDWTVYIVAKRTAQN